MGAFTEHKDPFRALEEEVAALNNDIATSNKLAEDIQTEMNEMISETATASAQVDSASVLAATADDGSLDGD